MIIYKTTNLIDNKIYIGKDSRNNCNYFGGGVLLQKYIKKYGKENFKKETLEYCDTEYQLNEREKYWIKELRSQDKTIGYNLSSGGENGTFGVKRSEEFKEKIRRYQLENPNMSMLGKKLSKETRKKMSKSAKGRKTSDETKGKLRQINLGKTYSEEIKRKQSEIKMGHPVSEETREKIRIANSGENNYLYGKHPSDKARKNMSKNNAKYWKNKHLSEQTKDKLRQINLGKKHTIETKNKIRSASIGKIQLIVECPYCKKIGGVNSMHRWHFDNCKKKLMV